MIILIIVFTLIVIAFAIFEVITFFKNKKKEPYDVVKFMGRKSQTACNENCKYYHEECEKYYNDKYSCDKLLSSCIKSCKMNEF